MSVPPDSPPIAISRGELLWLTISTWVGGLFLLTLLPVLVIPRLGIPLGMGVTYFTFFMLWQPVQRITQRVLGSGPSMVRMFALVASAAVLAFYLRGWLGTMAAG